MRAFAAHVLIASLACCPSLIAQPANKGEPGHRKTGNQGSIRGRVVEKGIQVPVRGVVVRLLGTKGVSTETQTDEFGAYVFPEVSPGDYHMLAERPGFVTVQYGKRRSYLPPAKVTVSSSESVDGIDFEMVRTPRLVGSVRDESGRPVEGCGVAALQTVYQMGERIIRFQGSTRTNDLGEYRLDGLSPGRYIVMTLPGVAVPDSQGKTFLRTYSPGVVDPRDAQPVELFGGASARVDFALTRKRLVLVAGHVAGGPGGMAGKVTLVLANTSVRGHLMEKNSEIDDEGGFLIRGVAPGSYAAQIEYRNGDQVWTAAAPLTVGDRDVADLAIPFFAPVRVTAAAVLLRPNGSDVPALHWQLIPKWPVTTPPVVENSTSNASAVFASVPPGEYVADIQNIPSGYYLRRVLIDRRESPDGLVRLLPGISNSEIVAELDTNGGVAQGVVSESGQPVPEALVVLVPTGERRNNPVFYRSAITDEQGQYLLPNVAPGEYQIFATLTMEEGAQYNPDVVRLFSGSATTIHIDEGTQATAPLSVAH